MEYIC